MVGLAPGTRSVILPASSIATVPRRRAESTARRRRCRSQAPRGRSGGPTRKMEGHRHGKTSRDRQQVHEAELKPEFAERGPGGNDQHRNHGHVAKQRGGGNSSWCQEKYPGSPSVKKNVQGQPRVDGMPRVECMTERSCHSGGGPRKRSRSVICTIEPHATRSVNTARVSSPLVCRVGSQPWAAIYVRGPINRLPCTTLSMNYRGQLRQVQSHHVLVDRFAHGVLLRLGSAGSRPARARPRLPGRSVS